MMMQKKPNQSSKWILLLPLLMLSALAGAQTPIDSLLYSHNQKCAIEAVSRYYNDGKIKECGQYLRDTVKTGKWCYWREDGEFDAIYYYDILGRDSLKVYYSYKGKPFEFFCYMEGDLNVIIRFDKNNKIESVQNFLKNGIIQIIIFDSKGHVKRMIVEQIINNRKRGNVKQFFDYVFKK